MLSHCERLLAGMDSQIGEEAEINSKTETWTTYLVASIFSCSLKAPVVHILLTYFNRIDRNVLQGGP